MTTKYIYILFFISTFSTYAQDISDAVRFARNDMMGTARFSAMGGAFSSLGGDMSSLKLNPAGSSVFLNNQASGTLNLNLRNNDVNFINLNSTDNETTFDLNQAGAVFVYTSNNDVSTVSKYSFGFTYDQVANYNDSFVARGDNNTNNGQSISQFFIDQTNDLPLEFLQTIDGESVSDLYIFLGENFGVDSQNALLGYQAYVFDPVDPDDINNREYVSNVTADNFRQNYFIDEAGYNGKFGFNASLELNKRFYFGLNLNAHYMEYERLTRFVETNSDPTSEINRIRFDNQLRTRASAFSFQLGTIAKITPQFRAALSYQSPTWYNVSYETEQYIETDRGNTTVVVNPNVLNVFPEYKYRTASVWRGGLSYVFGKKGLLSVDYSIQDFSQIKYTTNPLRSLNQGINQHLTTAANLNIGGEYVFKTLRFRGGYFQQESPYKDEAIMGDLTGYTFGIGHNFGNVNVDLAYTLASIERRDRLYNTGLSQTANVNTDESNIFLTLSFGF